MSNRHSELSQDSATQYEPINGSDSSPLSYFLSIFSLGIFWPFRPEKGKRYSKRWPIPTDILFIVLFIFFCYKYFNYFQIKLELGNPYKSFGLDLEDGSVCGKDEYSKRPFIYFKESNFKDKSARVCVSSCATPEEGLPKATKLLVFCFPEPSKDSNTNLGLDYVSLLVISVIQNINNFIYAFFLVLVIFTVLTVLLLISANILIILSAVLIILSFVGTGVLLVFTPKRTTELISRINVNIPNFEEHYLTIGISLLVLGLIFLILFLISLGSIQASIAITKKCIKNTIYFPSYLAVALLSLAAKVLLLGVGFMVLSQTRSFIKERGSPLTVPEICYGIFFFFWCYEIINYYTLGVITATAVEYNFGKSPVWYKLSFGLIPTLLWAIRVVVQIGTVFFAAAVMAVLETLLSVIHMLKRQLSSKENLLERIFFTIAQVFLFFLTWLADWLGQNGVLYALSFNTDFLNGMVVGNRTIVRGLGELMYPYLVKGIVTALLRFAAPLGATFSLEFVLKLFGKEEDFGMEFLFVLFVFCFCITSSLTVVIDGIMNAGIFTYIFSKEFDMPSKKKLGKLRKLEDKYGKKSKHIKKSLSIQVSLKCNKVYGIKKIFFLCVSLNEKHCILSTMPNKN